VHKPTRASLREYMKKLREKGEPKGLIVFSFYDDGAYLHAQCSLGQAKMAAVELVDNIELMEQEVPSKAVN